MIVIFFTHISFCQQLALMALFDWWEVVQFMREGWRCALTIPGGQCVMSTFGVVMTLQWSAGN